MNNTDIKDKAPQANTSSRERSKIDKRNARKFKSPNVSKMYGLQVGPRTTYFFHTKSKRNTKIKQLEAEGIEYEILN